MQRTEQQLIATKRSYPDVNKMIDDFRQSKGKDLPNWASFCFLPIAGWYAILCGQLGKPQLSAADMPKLHALSATCTWQFSKGIYDFDSDLYQALIDSEIKGDLPSEVLHRLPEWCLYINTPNYQFDGQPAHGFYAMLEHDMNDGHHELRLFIDADGKLISVPLHLGNWSVHDAVDKYFKYANLQSSIHGYGLLPNTAQTIKTVTDDIMPLLSLLLYICSDTPDLSNREFFGDSPQRPQAKKTKKGWRLFPAEKIKTWTVGETIGEHLRQTAKDYQSTDRRVKAHLRRGHHKTYWTGKRGSDEQKPVSRWIPPAIVAGGKED